MIKKVLVDINNKTYLIKIDYEHFKNYMQCKKEEDVDIDIIGSFCDYVYMTKDVRISFANVDIPEWLENIFE